MTKRIPEEVEAFARDNPRVDELSVQIATLLETGLAPDLATAYKLADMFMPATGAHTPEPKGAHTAKTIEHDEDEDEDLSAQTRKGSQSITGAPSVGSDPTRQQPSTSIKESLRRALARAG